MMVVTTSSGFRSRTLGPRLTASASGRVEFHGGAPPQRVDDDGSTPNIDDAARQRDDQAHTDHGVEEAHSESQHLLQPPWSHLVSRFLQVGDRNAGYYRPFHCDTLRRRARHGYVQPRIIACGNSIAAFAMAVRFITGPAVMAAASFAVGLKGVLLHIAVVQAALPQGIVPFVFAKEYNVHPDILSTGVIFGMLIALPVTLVYYILLGL
ncbi:uncharacterized protein A4U43_UnF8040 [Asparagus officinalis]|uniref:Auxin efflux carrier component n=1 Tax=Asparagus officinalis TaxID=4686 RepID=A0A1R3L614_ASPOF|nr:uncharacterized protein A4U43_UnF8040 [Asparagus officinalis]